MEAAGCRLGPRRLWRGSAASACPPTRRRPFDDAELPYLTFTPVSGAWGDGEQNVTVETWRRTESEARGNADAEAIGRALGLGGVMLPCDGGGLWVKRGSPFWQAADSGEPGVKRRYVNLSIENITTF